ncbi:hypothetical protein I4F81_004397 [Pyropia yezoensis]|uniref:Uncharacterized protein n=1 Tax=Pyropia yezoensis TaxID=2788 RepID=A0ACC3BV90_PYRYE|nr:hypothetical protein I4F81_004397 [Neopyropia yezoensis]
MAAPPSIPPAVYLAVGVAYALAITPLLVALLLVRAAAARVWAALDRWPALRGRVLGYPRGRALGGSSAINAKVWVHPTAADVDEWGVPGWTAGDLKGVRVALDAAVPLTRADEVGVGMKGGGACARGNANGLPVVATALRRAAADAGWPLVDDYNGQGGQLGAAYTTFSATVGDASNAYEALLRPAMAAHPGVLTILCGWEVTRVVLAPSPGGATGGDAPAGPGGAGAAAAPDAAVAATGVALTPSGGGAAPASRRRVAPMTARLAPGGEVFLCAGALASPVLLMRSGDHFLVPVAALARTRPPHRTTSGLDGVLFSRLLTAAPRAPPAGGDGPRSRPPHPPVRADTQSFFLSPGPLRAQLPYAASSLAAAAAAGAPRALRPSATTIAAATRALSAAVVHAPALAPLRAAVTDRVFSVASYTLRPTSRGRVSLCPRTGAVVVDPAGLSTAADMDAAVAAVVAGVRLLHTSPAVVATTGGPLLPLLPPVPTADVLSLLTCGDGGGLPPATAPVLPLRRGAPRVRAAVEAHVRAFGTTAWHALGTCRMGAAGGPDAAATAVVDGRLRVNGVARLRVVDLSVAPSMVSGNTNATAMTVGARGAELVREEWVARGWVPGG